MMQYGYHPQQDAFRRVFAFTALAVLSGCRDADRPASFVATDSADVAIMTSTAPEWHTDEAWTVDSVPAFAFGAAEGDSTELLYRVTSALLLHPDTVV
jgi:hypothetical protein